MPDVEVKKRFCNSIDVLIEDNKFERNIGAFSETAGAISLSCFWNVTHSDNSLEGERLLSYHGFLEDEDDVSFNYLIDRSAFKANMFTKTFPPLSDDIQYSVSEELVFVIDRRTVSIRNNQFNFNFASVGSAITFIHGFGSVLIDNDEYTDNGDVFLEAFQLYSPIISSEQSLLQVEDYLANLIGTTTEEINYLKSESIIEIVGASYVEIKNSIFESNWHKEFLFDLINPVSNTQIVLFKFCNGEVHFNNNIVKEHKGMYQNALLQETFNEIPFMEDGNGKKCFAWLLIFLELAVKGFINPLLDYSDDCLFSTFQIIDSTFSNNEGTALGKNEDEIRALILKFRRYFILIL